MLAFVCYVSDARIVVSDDTAACFEVHVGFCFGPNDVSLIGGYISLGEVGFKSLG